MWQQLPCKTTRYLISVSFIYYGNGWFFFSVSHLNLNEWIVNKFWQFDQCRKIHNGNCISSRHTWYFKTTSNVVRSRLTNRVICWSKMALVSNGKIIMFEVSYKMKFITFWVHCICLDRKRREILLYYIGAYFPSISY